MKIKKSLKYLTMVAATVAVALSMQSFTPSADTPKGDRYRTFVKTKNRCQSSICSCSGYWGYRHGNNTYEGRCSNMDGHGHTCGHGPEKHGLRKW